MTEHFLGNNIRQNGYGTATATAVLTTHPVKISCLDILSCRNQLFLSLCPLGHGMIPEEGSVLYGTTDPMLLEFLLKSVHVVAHISKG